MVEENLEKVKELDQSAVILGEKFHDLIEIEPGDPEARDRIDLLFQACMLACHQSWRRHWIFP